MTRWKGPGTTLPEQLEAAMRALPRGWFVAADVGAPYASNAYTELLYRGVIIRRPMVRTDPRRARGATFEYLVVAE